MHWSRPGGRRPLGGSRRPDTVHGWNRSATGQGRPRTPATGPGPGHGLGSRARPPQLSGTAPADRASHGTQGRTLTVLSIPGRRRCSAMKRTVGKNCLTLCPWGSSRPNPHTARFPRFSAAQHLQDRRAHRPGPCNPRLGRTRAAAPRAPGPMGGGPSKPPLSPGAARRLPHAAAPAAPQCAAPAVGGRGPSTPVPLLTQSAPPPPSRGNRANAGRFPHPPHDRRRRRRQGGEIRARAPRRHQPLSPGPIPLRDRYFARQPRPLPCVRGAALIPRPSARAAARNPFPATYATKTYQFQGLPLTTVTVRAGAAAAGRDPRGVRAGWPRRPREPAGD